jgi:hypothetical protein
VVICGESPPVPSETADIVDLQTVDIVDLLSDVQMEMAESATNASRASNSKKSPDESVVAPVSKVIARQSRQWCELPLQQPLHLA